MTCSRCSGTVMLDDGVTVARCDLEDVSAAVTLSGSAGSTVPLFSEFGERTNVPTWLRMVGAAVRCGERELLIERVWISDPAVELIVSRGADADRIASFQGPWMVGGYAPIQRIHLRRHFDYNFRVRSEMDFRAIVGFQGLLWDRGGRSW